MKMVSTYQVEPYVPFPLDRRLARAANYPWHIARLYFHLRRETPGLKRRFLLGAAKEWFHAWVWGYYRLPWEPPA